MRKADKKKMEEMGYIWVYREEIMKVILILFAIGAMAGGCSYINQKFSLKDDNPLEEFLEDLIEDQTELDLDLSPLSREN